MTNQATSIVERLSQAESPHSLLDWYKKPGYYVATCDVSREDVPDLIEVVHKWNDLDWPDDDSGLDEAVQYLPITAWRTLADLEASESVDALIDLICELEDFDDWMSNDLPHVFGKIGKPAVAALVQLATDPNKQEFVRTMAAEGLRWVAEYHAETRDEVVARLTEMMTKVTDDHIEFNSLVLGGLVDLQAVEAAEAIERAFANNRLDVGMMGDWKVVRRKLGVKGLGLDMPKHPYNTVERFRRRMGIGIFSDRAIFGDGEPDPAAEQTYYEQAWYLFSKSQEAEQVVARFGHLQWTRVLLEFGINYRGQIIDEMTLGAVDEFVFDYIPRKVSTESDHAAAIVFELTMFWEYLDRVYELPNARSIIEWLQTDELVASLEAELSNPANFGMAKSILMAGMNAGYDMTTEEGAAEFMAAYNQSVQGNVPIPPQKVPVSGRQRVGRNDPCPCGSGKKFKKCCR